MKNAEYWIKKLGLEKHPEGGWYRQIYKANEIINKEHLPQRYSGERHHSTSIYFLITSEDFSAFHKVNSDETFHLYEGSPVSIHIINKEGKYYLVKLGSDHDVFQYTIPHGTWFAAEVNAKDSYALMGCTVSPGFHFDDFELGKRNDLIKMFPEHSTIIKKFTRLESIE